MLSEKDLITLKKTLQESAQYMTREVKEENVAICIGATKSGKSTLINYLIGNKLKAVRATRVQPVTIVKADNESSGPEIGTGSTSKTTIPTRWTSNNLPDLVIWDAPGFDDNRGAVQDITNAFYLYQLVQNVESLKVVLVVDINDLLNDNIKHFLTVLKAVESLLGSRMKSLFSSISVIFTKVPNTLEDNTVDKQFINEKLTYQFLSSPDLELSQVCKQFINYVIDNNRVAFFKKPLLSNVTSAIDINIHSVIQNSPCIPKNTLKKLGPSIISESSKSSLSFVREKLISITSFTELQIAISDLCQIKIKEIELLLKNNPEIEKEIINELMIQEIEQLVDNNQEMEEEIENKLKTQKVDPLVDGNLEIEEEIENEPKIEEPELLVHHIIQIEEETENEPKVQEVESLVDSNLEIEEEIENEPKIEEPELLVDHIIQIEEETENDPKVQEVESLVDNDKEVWEKIQNLIIIKIKLMKAIHGEGDFYKKLEIVKSIDIQIKKKINEHNWLENIILIEFVDKLLDYEDHKILTDKFLKVLLLSDSKVSAEISLITAILVKIDYRKYKEIEHKLEKINKYIQELEKKTIKQEIVKYIFKIIKIIYTGRSMIRDVSDIFS